MRYLQHTDIILIDYNELVPEFISEENYPKVKKRDNLRVHGYGGHGRVVSIEVDSLPERFSQAIKDKFGDLHEYIAKQPIKQLIKTDMAARQFFATHILPSAQTLDLSIQQKYARQAEWLNMINVCLSDKKTLKEVLRINIDTFWQSIIDMHQVDRPINPELPVTLKFMRILLNKYNAEGYAGLVSKRFGNQNTRKVTDKIENLIFSLHNMDYKPTMADVCRLYRQFITGDLQVVDIHPKSGGEIFNPKDFYVKGEPYALAESTVQFYLKKMGNIIATHSTQIKKLEFNNLHRPYVIRKAPEFAFSKLSMDDRDLPFKDLGDDRSVVTYQIIDVASKCIVGKAYAIKDGKKPAKTVELIRNAFRDMYQLIVCNGWGFPAEMEMEKHLTEHMMGKTKGDGTFEQDVLTAGNLFQHVRVCLGGNAPEKRAEHTFRHIKYQFNNRRPGFIGRFYANSINYRFNEDQKATRYLVEQIIQNDIDDINGWNNSLHHNQELYPGMTRWDVLEQRQNEQLAVYPIQTVMPYIGYKVETSIKRAYVEVQYNKYRFPNLEAIAHLNNKHVEAYYIPGDMGIEKVYVYQGGKFIAECVKVNPFQEAVIEQTAGDLTNAEGQWGYQKHFDKFVKEKKGEVRKVGVAKFDGFTDTKNVRVVAQEVDVPTVPEYNEYEYVPAQGNIAARAAGVL